MWEWKTSGSTAPSKKDSGAVWLKKREENEDYFTSKNISNKSKQQSHSWVTVVCTGHLAKSKQLPRALSAKNANHLQTTDTIKRHQRYSIHYHCGWPSLGIWGSATHYGLPALPEPLLRARGLHRASRQIKTASKGIIRKECQSFTNHGHDKTPPTVFNSLSLWLTLPRNMGVSHTLWPPSITRATLACLWLAQGLHRNQKSKQQSHLTLPSNLITTPICIWYSRD